LAYSPIQSRMANQYCILPLGGLENVEVYLAGVKPRKADFEVIKILGDRYPYPSQLGIDWAFKNYDVIDMKKETMTFESDGTRVIQPLDPYQGPIFTEPTDYILVPDVIDHIYHMTAGKIVDYINPTADGSISWRSFQSSGL